MNKDTRLIPPGPYCYSFMSVKHDSIMPPTLCCPYLRIRSDKPVQMNGYCCYLEIGDWESEGHGLLWDQCKECHVNFDDNDEFYAVRDDMLEWAKNMLELNAVPEQQISQVKEWIDSMEQDKQG